MFQIYLVFPSWLKLCDVAIAALLTGISPREIIDNLLGLKDEWLGDDDKEEKEVEQNVTERLFSLMRLDSGR